MTEVLAGEIRTGRRGLLTIQRPRRLGRESWRIRTSTARFSSTAITLGLTCFGFKRSSGSDMTRTIAPQGGSRVINLRGQIVTAVDLRSPGLNDRPNDQTLVNVVVRTHDGAVSLLVDEIGDVLEVAETLFEHSPETLQSAARDLVRGAYKLEDRLVLLLDLDRVLQTGGLEKTPTAPPAITGARR